VDQLSWRWVFYVNLIPGLLAAGFVAFAWRDQIVSQTKPSVDYAGAGLLMSAVVTLLLGLMDSGTSTGLLLIAASIILFVLLLWVESRAADPILPLHLFRERLFAVTIAHGTLTGWAMFGSISFVPLFVQSVLGTSATRAGITIAPMLLGWVLSSIVGTRLLLRVGYRKLVMAGTIALMTGAFFMSRIGVDTSQTSLMIFVALMGIGMGLSIPPFLIAVQTSVERRYLGTATSTMQFSRSIGGTLGVSVMGAALSLRLASNLSASGLDPSLVSQLLEPSSGSEALINTGVRVAMSNAIDLVFMIAFAAAALSLVIAFLAPRKELKEKASESESVLVSAD
jgi:MFS family permease